MARSMDTEPARGLTFKQVAPGVLGLLIALALLVSPLMTGHPLHPRGLLEAAGGASLAVLCSATALAASRRPKLPLRTAAGAVMSVSAMNCVTPAGIGGTVLTLRLHRRTGLSAEDAAAAVAVRAVAGAIATAIGGCVAARFAGSAFHLRLPNTQVVIGGASVLGLVVLVAGFLARKRLLAAAGLARGALRSAAEHLASPKRAALLLAATLGLLAAQIVTLHGALNAVGAAPALSALLVAQVGANAVKSASPYLPGGLGAFEGALVAALAASGTALGVATVGVAVYRAIGQWIPVAGGVFAIGGFRRQGLV